MIRFFFFIIIAFPIFTACTSEDDFLNEDVLDQELSMSFSAGKQVRVLTPNVESVAVKQTRAAVTDPAAPVIPADAVEFDKEKLTNWNDGVSLSEGNNYKVTKPYCGKISANSNGGNGNINIYVSADAEFTAWWGSAKANIYILPGATLTWNCTGWGNMQVVPTGVNIYVWGNLTTPANKGLTLEGTSTLYVYDGEQSFVVNAADGNSNSTSLRVEENAQLYSSREVTVMGTAQFLGKVHFAESALIEGNLLPEGVTEITFDKCSKVLGQVDNRSCQNAVINVNECFYCGSLHDDGRKLTINLKEALLDIDHVFTTVSDGYKENRLTDYNADKIIICGLEGKYYSFVRILDGGVALVDKNGGYTVSGEWPNQYISEYPLNNFVGYVNILGAMENKLYWEPPTGTNLSSLTVENLVFSDAEVLFNDGNVYLPATENRPAIGNGAIIVNPDENQKYSATGLDFGPDGKVYLCWHTNAKTSEYGGIIDVLNVSSSDPQGYQLEQTMTQDEHKYNYVKYYNNKLYLASSSKKVGAALHELELVGGKMDESDKGKRVNLTGESANSVDVAGDNLVTISGRDKGGVNKFALTDYKNQEKKFVNEASSEFRGKSVYMDKVANKVITLNNTSRGIVTIYEPSTMKVEKSFEVGELQPAEGKNVCISDGKNIYVCRGQKGFDIYDFNGQKVGGSKKHANGCDVDDKYIYIATGDGFAILSKTKQDKQGYNKTLRNVKLTATGFVYPGSAVTEDVKGSANFIRVKDGNIYVAYGIYGLRIFKSSDFGLNN